MNETTPSVQRTLRFGSFVVDLQTSELHRNGGKLRLQEQPFRVLAALLDRPGQVVSRQELQRLLWPEGTFVDFEHGLNAVVNRLRHVLQDSAEDPQFIETLPRRGYRFIAPVARPKGDPGSLVRYWPRPVMRRKLAPVATVLALLGTLVSGLSEGVQGAVPTEAAGSLAVLPLRNLSGDPAEQPFVAGMMEELITQLSKVGSFNRVLSRHSVLLYRGSGKPIGQIADELGVQAVIAGSVLRAGSRVRINVQLIHVHPERQVWAESYEHPLNDVLALQREVARRVASEVELALHSPGERLTQATRNSRGMSGPSESRKELCCRPDSVLESSTGGIGAR